MTMNETIISKYIIKPSSPTPDSLKNHKLNFMDQVSPMIYMPFIFFYQKDEFKPNQQVEISQLLKQSLSQILTVFHPLAGTIQENLFVDCNDTGVEFVEAQVHACLAQVTEDPKMEELKQLIPVDSLSHSTNSAILLVKISLFDCGGIAIGVCLSHKVADLSSYLLFLNAWSAKCRGETQVIQPSFDLAVHFPPKGSIPSWYPPAKENITTNRLVFDREKLERLKRQATSGKVNNPTTVEALSVFIWQNFIEATKAIRGAEKTSFVALQAMDFRRKIIPPILNHTFGNCGGTSFVFTYETTDSSDLLSKLSGAIRAVDDNYVRKLTVDEHLRTIKEADDLFNSGTEPCAFSSWWRSPLYGVDFGWGKPVRVCTVTIPYKNTVYLMSTPSGDGIEAWINMPEDFFQMLKTSYNKLFN